MKGGINKMEINNKMTMLDLVTQYQIAVKWLEESEKINSSALCEFKKAREGLPLINSGVLISYAYMCLVVPQESDLFDSLKMNDKITEILNNINFDYNYNDDKSLKMIVKHFRNAIAHANIEATDDDIIVLYDINNRTKENARFSMRINILGEFINEIYYMQKKRFFESRGNE